MTTIPFHTTVLDNGMLAAPLPEEFRGKTVNVLTDDEATLLRLKLADHEFRYPKSLKQILAEQNALPFRFDDSIPNEPAWESKDDFVAFLESIGEDPSRYQ
jgi:hypothetical protein